MSAALTVDGRDFGLVGIDFLAGRLGSLSLVPRTEVWLAHSSGSSLCVLKSDDTAILMLLRREGDAGLVSRSSDEPRVGSCEFRLANGQVDTYPASWTVPFHDARRVAEFFWFSGTPAPFVRWHDDAA
jgi:hypothetical protein